MRMLLQSSAYSHMVTWLVPHFVQVCVRATLLFERRAVVLVLISSYDALLSKSLGSPHYGARPSSRGHVAAQTGNSTQPHSARTDRARPPGSAALVNAATAPRGGRSALRGADGLGGSAHLPLAPPPTAHRNQTRPALETSLQYKPSQVYHLSCPSAPPVSSKLATKLPPNLNTDDTTPARRASNYDDQSNTYPSLGGAPPPSVWPV